MVHGEALVKCVMENADRTLVEFVKGRTLVECVMVNTVGTTGRMCHLHGRKNSHLGSSSLIFLGSAQSFITQTLFLNTRLFKKPTLK